MKNVLTNQWNVFRIVRLVLGVAVIIQGIIASEILLVIAGIVVSGMALLNAGCCGAAGCHVPVSKKKTNAEEISYEEVVK